jgi:hypothetical protein
VFAKKEDVMRARKAADTLANDQGKSRGSERLKKTSA